jgi:nicotinamide N-methyltransferase
MQTYRSILNDETSCSIRWDDLSHADLLKSITSLLRKGHQSRVYMVSGLHTGRSKIVSFLRRAYRCGLQLVPFPTSPSQEWPKPDPAELSIQEKAASDTDDILAQASKYVLEWQILSHESEEAPAYHPQLDDTPARIWQAKTTRLNGNRRSFVIEEREEEKMKNQGVHARNQWITFSALAWR